MNFLPGHWYERPKDAEPDWPAAMVREVDRTMMHPIQLSVVTSSGQGVAGELGDIKPDRVELEGLLVTRVPWAEIQALMVAPDAPLDTSDELRPDTA